MMCFGTGCGLRSLFRVQCYKAAAMPPRDVMRAEVMRELFGSEAETVTAGDRAWGVPRAGKNVTPVTARAVLPTHLLYFCRQSEN